MTKELQFQIRVPRPGFEEAARLIRKLCKPKREEQAVLSFDGACLHIECAGMAVTPAAVGLWPGQVRVPSDFIKMLAKMPPPGDDIEFRVADGRLHVGSSSVTCAIQASWSKMIELSGNSSFGEVLSLHVQHTPEEIAAAGYSKMVENAVEWGERRVEKVCKELTDFMVEPAELRAFLFSNMKRKLAEGHRPA
jgi:hypothetical protein